MKNKKRKAFIHASEIIFKEKEMFVYWASLFDKKKLFYE
jgi:hypothetical protein